MDEEIKKLSVEEVIKLGEYEGIVRGVPTGTYADRNSYGNAPMLAIILDNILPCKFRAKPYSHRRSIQEGVAEVVDPFGSLTSITLSFVSDDENENLGLAAAFIDQSIRNKSEIEIHGTYKEGILYGQFLRIGRMGFEFPGYKMPFERRSEKEEAD